ncbi:Hsp70 protein, putative [Trypanosoma equiperdum]|uniref:Uncharacterized protein n=2 Tax=Trypanozoon TaxID=39700 RepID=Q38E16_TRYB2|nr:hypothetical protein, conserved [Trypanosoma brucei brucei TREU927]EAN76954.1 hypothetical protein, conserved [Trypanosoma brucei brucei TREU927]SCU72463.1 Hsp70 protein, putative [Trypanosoma equiperdum]
MRVLANEIRRMLVAFLLTAAFGYDVTSANVIGVDFGSDYIEVAGPINGVNVDIILNEQSHRKTDNYIGFRNGERSIGAQAKSLAARFPTNMIAMINHLVGITYNSSDFANFKKLQCEFDPHPEERGTVGFRFEDNNDTYTAEEIYAMMLNYCRSISEKAGVPNPQNVVITLPFHSSLGRRQTILEAARLVHINTLGLLHSTTATALYYGVRRRGFGNRTVHLLVYDIGSTHTEVGVYKFSPPVQEQGKRTKNVESFGTLTTMGIVSDATLGGRALDSCIAKGIEAEAISKMKISPVLGGSTVSQRKAQFSLFRAAKRAREVLSVNSKTPVTVEGIAPDRDFSTEVSRKEFETNCSELLKRFPRVAQEAVTKSSLTLKDIDAFEMMGGASRTPKIISDLSTFWGKEVNRTLNSDEAAAMGAAYYALRLSPHYRPHSFRIIERVPYTFLFAVSPEVKNSSNSKRMLANNPIIGSRWSITVNRTDDFSIQLFDSDARIGNVNITGVKGALERLGFFQPKLNHTNNSHIIRIQVRFNESGLLEVEEAGVFYRYAVNVSSSTKTTGVQADSNSSNESGYVVEMKRKSARLSARVTFTNPEPLSYELLNNSRVKIFQLLEKERKKHEAATAKNNLETYLFWAKTEGILENTTALEPYTPEEVNSLKNALAEAQEWLEDGDGSNESCSKEEYENKLATLKELVKNSGKNKNTTNTTSGSDDAVKGDL